MCPDNNIALFTQKLQDVIYSVIERNAFFAHPKNLSLSMITLGSEYVREFGFWRIRKAIHYVFERARYVREFVIPISNFVLMVTQNLMVLLLINHLPARLLYFLYCVLHFLYFGRNNSNSCVSLALLSQSVMRKFDIRTSSVVQNVGKRKRKQPYKIDLMHNVSGIFF